jgi:hypothetical protein
MAVLEVQSASVSSQKAAQQSKSSRITTLPFFQVGYACDVGFGLKITLPARNRLILGRWAHG